MIVGVIETCSRGKIAAEWSEAETRALIAVWGEADIQGQLDSVKRKKGNGKILEESSGAFSARMDEVVEAMSC